MPQQIKQAIMSRFPTARWERWLIENHRKVCYHFMEYYAGRENHTMIYVKRAHLDRFLGLCPALDTAIRHLAQADLSALAPGRNEVDGDEVYINRLDYATIPEEQAAWEGHARYGDIHIMIAGQERIGVSDTSQLTPTVQKEAEDFLGFEGPVRVWYPMEADDVLIVFPEDAHMVKVELGGAMPVSRAVVKFRV